MESKFNDSVAVSILNGGIFQFSIEDNLDAEKTTEEDEISSHHLINYQAENFESLSIPSLEPYDRIASKMDKLDDYIFKQELKQGFGPVVKSGQQILVHYVMYCENTLEPFDSTLLRNKPICIKTGEGKVILGLENAILSMKTKEISKFLFNWVYAFGTFGCPPRIPPKAVICCFIEIIRIIACPFPEIGDGEFATITNTFANTIEECNELLETGKALYISRKFEESIRRLRKAHNILEHLALKNEDEQKIMENLSMRVVVNLGAIYNHCNKPELACTYLQIALRINPYNEKALFNYGRANIRLNNFNVAENVLKTGITKYPDNKTFTEELKRLSIKKEDFLAREDSVNKIKDDE